MEIKRFSLLLLTSTLFILNCDPDPNSPLGLAFDPPQCVITHISEEDHRPGRFARYYLTVSNKSDPTAFYVGCTIKLKRGSLIIDRGSAYFGTLEPGESAIDDTVFPDIETHDDYTYSEIVLYWYDANGDYYEKYY